MGWFDENVEGYMPYEEGGYAGPGPVQVEGPPLQADPGLQDAPPAAAAPAFDQFAQVGHDGTFNGMNREQWRDAWMSSGASNPQQAKDWFAKNGGRWQVDNGTVMTPFGESMDLLFNARGSAQTGSGARPIWGGGGGGVNAQAPPLMDAGAGNPYANFGGGAPSGGGGASFSGLQGGWDGTKFTATPITMPQNYVPTNTVGPQNYAPETITAQTVTAPDAIRADQVQGPDALTAQQIAGAEKFQGVSLADMMADPSYQLRLKEGADVLQNAAASKGMARSGNTWKGLIDYGQQQASKEYANVYGRKFGEYTTGLADRLNVGTANNAANAQAYGLTNQFQQGAQIANQGANLAAGQFNAGQQQQANLANAGNNLQAQTANAGNRLNAWNAYQGMNQQNQQFNAGRQDQAAQQNFANQFSVQNANNANAFNAWQGNTNAQLGQGQLALGYQNAQNTRDLGFGNIGLGYHQANQSYDLGLRNNALGYYSAGNSYNLGQGNLGLGWANYGLNADQQQFNQGYSLANLGLTAAGAYGNYAGQYGQNAGNLATGAGNAAAAGQVGSANAWNQGFTGAANAGMGAYGAYLANQRDPVYGPQ